VRVSISNAEHAPAARQDPSPLYAIGDIHGHAAALVAALAGTGLTDADGHWTGGTARLWFLGDLTDRGPDGIGVIELIQRLDTEASAAGGQVDTLLGNHEILLLGSRRFGDEPIELPVGTRSFAAMWRLNGGRDADLAQLTDEQAEWLRGRSAMVLVDDHLLAHSDTVAYLDYGDTVPAVNEGLRAELASDDVGRWWECFRQLTRRHDFRGEDGPARAAELLDRLGGRMLVHGHSPIPEQLGVDPEEVREPHRYAGGRVVCLDGGLFAGGPCLVARLPLPDPAPAETADEPAPDREPAPEPSSGSASAENRVEAGGGEA
jgi:Calcineurin-like phosphoesterase